jgi:DNA invertase Pin-like site-specific DNA recombinase
MPGQLHQSSTYQASKFSAVEVFDPIWAVAQFERDLLIERTQAGLRRAWAEGKKSGRKAALTDSQRAAVRAALEAGETVSAPFQSGLP